MALTVAVALAAAVSFGWSTALMHHSASGAPAGIGGPITLLRHLVGQSRWLVGLAASLIGFGLHALALHLGSLAVVQPLVVTGLVFSFAFRAALDGRLPSRYTMAWGIVTASGVGVFLVGVSATAASGTIDGPGAETVLAAGSAVAAVTCIGAARAQPRHAGLLLGISAGVVFGLIAGVLKATLATSAQGAAMLTTWPLYALALLGGAGLMLNQRTYHQTSLASSLPALNTVNPVVAVAFGVLGFHEYPSEDPLAIAAQVVGLAGMLVGVLFLARHDDAGARA